MYCEWPYLDRCCFCMPLRRGVLVCGYVNIVFCSFAIGFHSYVIHKRDGTPESIASFPSELSIAMSCIEILFSVVLIYGAHTKTVAYVRAFYYFVLIWTVAMAVIQMIEPFSHGIGFILEVLILVFAFICLQLYLITLVRSLLRKLDMEGPHVYANQLAQIVNGDTKVESNGVYNNTTSPAVL